MLASPTGPGRYNVTIGYQVSNDKLREIHESGDDLTDSFTLVVDDGHGECKCAAAFGTLLRSIRVPLKQSAMVACRGGSIQWLSLKGGQDDD